MPCFKKSYEILNKLRTQSIQVKSTWKNTLTKYKEAAFTPVSGCMVKSNKHSNIQADQ